MPPDLKRIMEEYDQKVAEEEASRSWFARNVTNTAYAPVLGIITAGIIASIVLSLDDVRGEAHYLCTAKLLRWLSPSQAEALLLWAARRGLLPRDYDKDDPYLVVEIVEGLRFPAPVGLAAGLDRHAVATTALLNLGFGFVEVGPVAAHSGKSEATSAGNAVAQRLQTRDRRGQLVQVGQVGAAIRGAGASQQELLGLVTSLAPCADFLLVDLGASTESGKSTPSATAVAEVVRAAAAVAPSVDTLEPGQELGQWPRVFMRLAIRQSDLTDEGRKAAMDAACAALAGGAIGLMVCDETGQGAASVEAPLVALLPSLYEATEGRLALVASGHLKSGADALRCIEAGATLVEITSAELISEGLVACRRIKSELAANVMRSGHVDLQSAVGASLKSKRRGRKRNRWKGAPSAEGTTA